MRGSLLIFIGGVILAFGGRCALAQKPAPAHGFDAFTNVQTRNVFDPQRFGSAAPASQASTAAAAQAADYVALTGILITGDKSLAFFSGSRVDYDKVMAVDGVIAGAKVTKITPNAIEVDRNGNKISINVGQTVPFDNSAPVAAPDTSGDSTGSAASAGSAALAVASASPSPNALPSNLSDVMRRMMERRQQELK